MAGKDLSAEIFGPVDGGTQGRDLSDEIFGAVQPVKQAGFSLGDIAKSLGIGAAGSTKALTDVAGAENFLSSKLGKGIESLQKSLTPERQAELERQAARMKAAEESGSLFQEIKAGALNVAEAPIQSAAQAIGSFAPYLPAMFAAPAFRALGLFKNSISRIEAVAAQAPKLMGTAQGAGAVKGAIYDGVLQAEMEAGVDRDLAKKKADAAQSYFGGNFDQIALGGGLGFLAGSTGVEKFFTPLGRSGVAPGLGRRVAGAALSESLPEAAQGGQERLAQNIALQREGFDVDTFKGVAGAATQEALTGALGAVPIAALVKPEVKPPDNKVLEEREAFAKEFGEGTPVDADLTPDAPDAILEPAPEPIQLPGGFTVTQRELSREDVPEAFGIFAEGSDKPLSTVSTQADAETKLASLAEIRQEEQARLLKETDTITKSILGEQRKLDVMEATGQTDTDEYVQAKAMLGQTEEAAAVQIEELNNKIASYSAPLSLAPIGIKTNVQSDFVATRGAEVIGTFPTFEVAEATLRAVEPEVFKQADIEARKIEVKNRTQQFDDLLRPMFTKFNLGDVGLNVVEEIKTQGGALADGSFSRNLIQIAMDAPKPIQIMRHETVHALKELGFFTPQQYKALTERAEKQWIKQYLEGNTAEVNGVQMSRLEAYKELAKDRNLTPEQLQEEIAEEAIADAFGAYDRGETPPPGLIATLYKKLKNFFMNFGQALRGAGFESSEDIFDRIERGELKSSAPKAEQTEKVEQKFSVKQPKKTDEEIEANDVSRLIGSGPYAEAALRIVNSPIEKTSKPLEVDQVGVLYDSVYFEQFKRKGDWRNAEDFRTAVAQAVTELNKQLQQAKSGLDWYEEDIATAFTLTQRFIPSLKKPEKRALFSVIAGIMSPSTNARDNWLIAAQAYQHYEKTGTLPGFNPANNALWMGGLESANKKKQLDMLNAMLQPKSKGGLGEKATVEWLQGEHTVSEITAFRKKYGNMGKSSTGGKMNDILPGYTAFGPKVGPFVMNINGIHEVTVDVWMTRTFNRYFGRMMGPDGKMLRGPTEPERIAIKKLVTDAAQAVNIKPYQVQSVLWFFEQQLFNKLGTGAKSYGFSDGANKFSETQSGAGVSKVPAPDISTDAAKDRPAGKQAVRDSKQTDTKPARSDQPKDGVIQDETARPAKSVKGPSVGGKFSLEQKGERDGDREGRDTGRSLTPLAGAPIISEATGPDENIVNVAELYAKRNGIPYKRQAEYVEVNEDFAKLIAQAYEDMPNAPQDPAVKEAYADMNRQTRAQFEALLDAGYEFTFFDSDSDPYGGNPFNAMRDLRKNKKMAVYGTYDGYGMDGITAKAIEANPMLADTGLRWKDQSGKKHMVTANDLFRAVHDAFGHGLEGAGFRARGEENAWQAHARLFTGPSVGAITSETRGQNSWLNYGPSGEKNRTAKLEDTVFAEQKTGLLPEWAWTTGLVKDATVQKLSLRTAFPSAKEAEDAAYKKAAPETREFKLFFGGSQIMEEGRPQVMYHGSASEFTTFLENKPIFVSPEANFAEQFAEDRAKDEGKSTDEMRVYPLFVRAETPFDYENKEHAAMVTEKIIADQKLSGPDSVVRLKKSTPKASTFKKEIAGGLWSTIEDPIFQDALKSFGFDSFYVKEYGNKNLAVFSASQVKSVTGNIGEFGRESKDMRFSLPTIQTAITDRVNETTFTRERKNFAQRMVDAITPESASANRAAFLNRYNQMSVQDKKLAEQMGGPALLADQSSESAALMSDLGAGIAASAMGMGNRNGGIPVLRNGITTIDTSVKGMIASLAPLASYGDPKVYQYYQYWAMVKRGQRLNKQGKLTGITTTDVAYAKEIEAKFPKDLFNSVQKDLIAFNNGLVKYMVDTGVLSQQNGAEFVKYADYIPFYRQMDGQKTLGPNLFQSLSGVKPPKKLKGAIAEEAPLADFLETMVRNTQSAIQAGIKNYAGQRAMNVAVQLTAPGMGATRLKTVSQAPNVINVLEKGLAVSYETPDTLLIEAVKSLNLSDLPFMGILSAPADLLRNLVTKDPGFMMANLLRDSLSAYVTSGVKMTPVADTVIGFGKALARTSPGFEALLNAGIIGGYEFSANIEQSGRNLEDDLSKKAGKKDPILLRPFTSLWGALETGTTASDAATRALIYERVLADTGNEAEALYRSLEVMNFHRKGNSALIRVMTAAVPFFNARLQGLDLFYRASTGNMNNRDAAQIQRQFFVRGLTMMALSVMYYFMVSDDEEYKKQEQETKDNNWLIPSLGIRIPIPFEVGVLFKTIPERIAAYVFGNDTGQDLRDALFRSAVGTFAFNPIPQTVKPIVEAAFNINTFTFRPIVSEGMKDVDPQFQVGPGTSSVAKGIAGALGLSPMKVDHILKGYTGTIGMYGIDTIDAVMDQFSDSPRATKRFEQLPIIKRFTVDPEARGNVTEYYKLKDSVDTVVRTMNFLEKQGESAEFVEYLKKNQGTLAFKDYIRDTEKTMKELRQAKSAVQISQMSGDEKRDAITNINRAESAINSEIQRIKKIIASSQ